MNSVLNQGSVLVAPLSNLSDYKVLVDNAGSSLKDILVINVYFESFYLLIASYVYFCVWHVSDFRLLTGLFISVW